MNLAADPGVGLVSKQTFSAAEFKLTSGHIVQDLNLGYETYGKLNERGDNAILITHYFTGNSHCAGRYSETDIEVGYWDALIGPGRAIDTERFFVVSVDSLCNIGARDPRVITTGPASVDPTSGKPYGLRFPLVSIQDFVHSQRLVLQSLGVERLHAVCGPSMGAMQALEWGATFPELTPRVLAVIPGQVEADAYLIARVGSWMLPVLRDPNWKNGEYYDGPFPETGLADALRQITLDTLHYDWAARIFDRRPHDANKHPAAAIENRFAIETAISDVASVRARTADANSLLYLAKCVQTFSLRPRLQNIRSKVLILPASSDLLLFPAYGSSTFDTLRGLGLEVQLQTLEGTGGHLDGLYAISRAQDTIRRFLDS